MHDGIQVRPGRITESRVGTYSLFPYFDNLRVVPQVKRVPCPKEHLCVIHFFIEILQMCGFLVFGEFQDIFFRKKLSVVRNSSDLQSFEIKTKVK